MTVAQKASFLFTIALTTTRVASSASRTLMKTLVQSSLWRKGMVRRRAQSILHSLLRARLTASRFVAPSASWTELYRDYVQSCSIAQNIIFQIVKSFSIAHGYGAESFILRFVFVCFLGEGSCWIRRSFYVFCQNLMYWYIHLYWSYKWPFVLDACGDG